MNINFLFPNFLWMSLLALLPLVIHLINLRKHKVVYFSDISLLKNIQSISNSSKKIKNWLILLIRMLLIVFISIVFAQPYIPNNNQKFIEGKSIAIFLDTSPSMQNSFGLSNSITSAKNVADEIIQSYHEGTLFKVFTSENLSKAQFPNNSNRSKDIIAQTKIGNYSTNFNQLYKRIVNDEDIQALHVISDFLDELDTNQFNHLLFPVNYYPIKYSQSTSLIIDSVYFDSPIRKLIGEEELKITSRLQGDIDSSQVKFSVKLDNFNYYISSNLGIKNSESSVVFPVVSNSIVKGFVQGEFSEALSNKVYWSFTKKNKIKVLLVSNNSEIVQILQRVYGTEDLIDLEVVTEQNVDFTKVNFYDLLILGGLNQIYSSYGKILNNFTQQGKVICVIPSQKINYDSYNQFYQNLNLRYEWIDNVLDTLNASNLDVKHHFFKDMFKNTSIDLSSLVFPKVFQYYNIQINSPENINLISLNNLSPWLSLQNNCFTMSSSISVTSTNLKQHPLIVALFLKIALFSSQNQNLYYPIHQNSLTNFSSKTYPQLKIKTPDSSLFNWIPSSSGLFHIGNEFNDVGFYEVYSNDSLIDVLSINIPSYEYSIKNTSFINNLADLDNVVEVNSNGNIDISVIQQGKKISIYFIWIIIILLIIESLVLFKIINR